MYLEYENVFPKQELCRDVYQNVIFSGEIKKSGKSDFFTTYTSCWNFVQKYIVLRKLCNFPFTRTLSWIHENLSRYPSEKICNLWSKAARAFKFCHFMLHMMHSKVTNYWGSGKISSMCKIENAAVGANLHHHPGIGLEAS